MLALNKLVKEPEIFFLGRNKVEINFYLTEKILNDLHQVTFDAGLAWSVGRIRIRRITYFREKYSEAS